MHLIIITIQETGNQLSFVIIPCQGNRPSAKRGSLFWSLESFKVIESHKVRKRSHPFQSPSKKGTIIKAQLNRYPLPSKCFKGTPKVRQKCNKVVVTLYAFLSLYLFAASGRTGLQVGAEILLQAYSNYVLQYGIPIGVLISTLAD